MDYSDLIKFTYYNNLYNVFNTTINTAENFGMFAATSLIGTIPPPKTLYDLYTKELEKIYINEGKSSSANELLISVSSTTNVQHCSAVKSYNNKSIFEDKNYALLHFTYSPHWNSDPIDLSFGLTNSVLNWDTGDVYGIVNTGDILDVDYCPSGPTNEYIQETIWFFKNQYRIVPTSPYDESVPPILEDQWSEDTWPYKIDNTELDFYLFANKIKQEIHYMAVDSNTKKCWFSPMLKPYITLNDQTKMCLGFVTLKQSINSQARMYVQPIDFVSDNMDSVYEWMKSILV